MGLKLNPKYKSFENLLPLNYLDMVIVGVDESLALHQELRETGFVIFKSQKTNILSDFI